MITGGNEDQRRTNFINRLVFFVLFAVTLLIWIIPESSVAIYTLWGSAWLLAGFFCVTSFIAVTVWIISIYQWYVKQKPIDLMPYRPQDKARYSSFIVLFFMGFTLWQFDYLITLNWLVGAFIALQICGLVIRLTWRQVTLSPMTP